MSVPQSVGYVSAAGVESAAHDGSAGAPPAAGDSLLYFGLPRENWIKIGVLGALFCATFRLNLLRLWEKTNPINGEPNWGHAIIIPFIGLYYLYVNRDALLSAPRRRSWLGLGFLILGLMIFVYGIYPGKNDFVKDFGMVVTLFGLVAMQVGWAVMKIAWFPIAFLVCGIPWPGLVYSMVASPLQQLAATVAVNVLEMTGVQAYVGGTKIFMYGQDNVLRTLNVAEACAGLRSLMTFISVAGAVAFLSSRPLWQKFIVMASAIPIAICCNVTRVAGQGLLDHYVSQQLSENFAHQFVGLIMLVPAFLLILGVGWVLDQMFLDEADASHVNALVVRRSGLAERAPTEEKSESQQPAPPAITPPPPPRSAGRPLRFSPRGLPPTTQKPPDGREGKP